MGKRAKPLQEQVSLLMRRGMRIDDPERARVTLLEIGFYRMSFYWFPFETRWPDATSGVHRFRDGADFRDAFMLYAFDFKLRHLLLRPIERIETAFRNYMIYHVSTRYPDSPAWFADRRVVTSAQASGFERAIYYPLKRNNAEIQLHHRRFPADKFAPAWKTLEFVTLGTMCSLYEGLQDPGLKHEIAVNFGCMQQSVFSNYLEVLRDLRNICAHGGVLYSYSPPQLRRTAGAHGRRRGGHSPVPRNLAGALEVICHLLGRVSEREVRELRSGIAGALSEFGAYRGTADVLRRISGFDLGHAD